MIVLIPWIVVILYVDDYYSPMIVTLHVTIRSCDVDWRVVTRVMISIIIGRY